MQGPTFVPPGHVPSMQIFEELLQFYGDEWSRTESGYQQHPTNAEALGYVLDHYMFRMGDVNKVVLFGWRDPGTISEQRAIYNNEQMPEFVLSKLQFNMTQLAIALKILQFLEQKFEFKEFELHVCSENLSEATQARLRELRITTFRRHELPDHIDGNSFVYDVTNNSAIFRASVVHRRQEIMNSPPVVLTHMDSWLPNGRLDREPENIDSLSDLLEKYWLGPLVYMNPSVFARAETLGDVGWVYRQQWQSQTTQEFYSEWGAPFTFLNETGMALLCRKDCRRNQDGDPVQAPQPRNPLPQQQRPGYQFRRGR